MAPIKNEQGLSIGLQDLCLLCLRPFSTTNSTENAEVSEVTQCSLRPLAKYLGLDWRKLFDVSSMSTPEDSWKIELLQRCQLLLQICGTCGNDALKFNQKCAELERLKSEMSSLSRKICEIVAQVGKDGWKRLGSVTDVGCLTTSFWAEIVEKGAAKHAIHERSDVQATPTSSASATSSMANEEGQDDESSNPKVAEDKDCSNTNVVKSEDEGPPMYEPSHVRATSERRGPQTPATSAKAKLHTEQLESGASNPSSKEQESVTAPRPSTSQQRGQPSPTKKTRHLESSPKSHGLASKGVQNSPRHHATHQEGPPCVCSKCQRHFSPCDLFIHWSKCLGAQSQIQKCLQAASTSTSSASKAVFAEATRNGCGNQPKTSRISSNGSNLNIPLPLPVTLERVQTKGGEGDQGLYPLSENKNKQFVETFNDRIGPQEQISQPIGSKPPPLPPPFTARETVAITSAPSRQAGPAGGLYATRKYSQFLAQRKSIGPFSLQKFSMPLKPNAEARGDRAHLSLKAAEKCPYHPQCQFHCGADGEKQVHLLRSHPEHFFQHSRKDGVSLEEFQRIISKLLFDEFIDEAGHRCNLCQNRFKLAGPYMAPVKLHLIHHHMIRLERKLEQLQAHIEFEGEAEAGPSSSSTGVGSNPDMVKPTASEQGPLRRSPRVSKPTLKRGVLSDSNSDADSDYEFEERQSRQSKRRRSERIKQAPRVRMDVDISSSSSDSDDAAETEERVGEGPTAETCPDEVETECVQAERPRGCGIRDPINPSLKPKEDVAAAAETSGSGQNPVDEAMIGVDEGESNVQVLSE